MKHAVDAIPILSRDVIKREDTNGVLLFQVYSDEMYFISFAAYELFLSQCDGSATLGSIVENMGEINRMNDGENKIENFIDELLNRKIIQFW